MTRLVIFMSMALLLVTVGCTSTTDLSSPEQIIETVLASCREGDYAAAASHFEGGQERFKKPIDWMSAFFDRISDNGNAKTFTVRDRLERGDTLVLQILTYSEKQEPLGQNDWSFKKTRSGWVVTGVK